MISLATFNCLSFPLPLSLSRSCEAADATQGLVTCSPDTDTDIYNIFAAKSIYPAYFVLFTSMRQTATQQLRQINN